MEKIDFISFIICYLKIVVPVVHEINFIKETNSLEIRYRLNTGKLSRNRSNIFEDEETDNKDKNKEKDKYAQKDR